MTTPTTEDAPTAPNPEGSIAWCIDGLTRAVVVASQNIAALSGLVETRGDEQAVRYQAEFDALHRLLAEAHYLDAAACDLSQKLALRWWPAKG